MLSVTPWCPFKTHSRPYSLTYLWIYSILSFFLLTRQWCCSKEVVTLLLLGCYLSESKPFMEKTYVGFHLLVSFVTSFSTGYIFCDYVFIIFLLIILLRPFYSDSSCLILILLMDLSFVTSNDHVEGGQSCVRKYCSSPIVYKKIHNFLINQKWIVYFKMTPNCILCLFGRVSKLCMCFAVN